MKLGSSSVATGKGMFSKLLSGLDFLIWNSWGWGGGEGVKGIEGSEA